MSCPDCESVTRAGGGDGAWIARETLAGRMSTLPASRKAWLAAGVVVVTGALVTAVSFLASAGGETRTGAVGRPGPGAGDRAGGAPTRISPSAPATFTPSPPSSPSSPAASARPGYRYTAWAGPGCSTGEYREYGRFENGDAGWYTVDAGGFRGSSCDGRFSAVPMSGSPDEDRGSTATWSWHLGAGFRECALTVFVPRSDRDQDVAGNPTVYRVLSDPFDADSAYTGFAVRQTVHRGSAVDVDSYPVKGDTFAVQLIDRGRDWGSTQLVGAHHAAAQLRASCR
ncbi:adhesin [Streptomyces poriferorum]|uniref:Adhesin n=1 Tax=Streptomyces poriferorum TaxID=2798799 RepID=A0ABY9ISN2_9ACTN|nr:MULTISPECIES: adhesin [unclassified Streptomyces]MDP5312653.1 adhesin [Streptomyces sp. Alt4]WLQ58322.1 adhesin [Streptomyces sp. Alt2]